MILSPLVFHSLMIANVFSTSTLSLFQFLKTIFSSFLLHWANILLCWSHNDHTLLSFTLHLHQPHLHKISSVFCCTSLAVTSYSSLICSICNVSKLLISPRVNHYSSPEILLSFFQVSEKHFHQLLCITILLRSDPLKKLVMSSSP